MTLDFSFRKPEPYYSEGVSTLSLQRENSSEENMLQKESGGDGFLEQEEVNKRLGRSGQQSLENIHEVLVHSENESESPMNTDLPMLTLLTEESIQNVDPRVIPNPISCDSCEANVTFDESFVYLKFSSKISKKIK